MCGLSGFISPSPIESDLAFGIASKMADAIVHRGPDASGIWSDTVNGVYFVHRRLAVQDLTSAGHQPMVSVSQRFVIVFNGEIYNHLAIRKLLEKSCTLESRVWTGHSDTETLLTAIENWGLEKTLRECIGMFALALWDRETRVLSLARDRMGEKPLYYGWQGSGTKRIFLFGSELKALRAHPDFRAEIDRDAIALQARHNYIPAPYTIYRGIRKLAPGHVLELPFDDGVAFQDEAPPSRAYWSLDEALKVGRDNLFSGNDTEAIDSLDLLLRDAIGQQMLADVPLGAFLSGGIDSSTVVGIMQSLSARPVKTFTIGFDEAGMNEAVFAKEVSRSLRTDHTELYVTSQMAMDVIPQLADLYDEPFSDSSQIPTYLVSKLAKQHVTVSLSGDAGDELFCGYSRYKTAAKLWEYLERVPRPIRVSTAGAIRSLSVETWSKIGSPIGRLLKSAPGNIGDRAYKFAELLTESDRSHVYRRLISHWTEPDQLVLGARESVNYFSATSPADAASSFYDQMMTADMHTYLPDDILTKVDRAAMGVSLETRVPFLDHRVVELAARMPLHMKLRDGQGKWILRQVLYRYVPKDLIERPKMGFGVPIDAWLRGPLRGWAEDLLDERRLREEGFFNPEAVRVKWDEHCSGRRNWQYHLWDILMFQAWLDRWH